MCGIAGYMGSKTIEENQLQQSLAQMNRRGPDAASFRHWTNKAGKNIYLLHSRLRIIDLDPRSNQPFSDQNQSLVFNGELYNYVEIRKELEERGETFRTDSDTEVLLRALRLDGWAALDRFEGMWAFALYNETEETLSFCRDRFGEKPLYLYQDATGLYFGSEIKFITALLGRRLNVKKDHVFRYLVNGYKSLYKTKSQFFENLEELPSSTYRVYGKDGRSSEKQYWTPRFAPNEALSFEGAVKEAKEKLIRSVELRLRADVPLAFCMSGGIDSNALIAIAKREFNYDVHGFTVTNTDKRYEENDMVQTAVQALHLRHTAVPVEKKDFIPNLRTLIQYHDAPIYTLSYYMHWRLMKEISAADYRISISGTAADELFSGYFDHHLAYLHDIRNNPVLLEKSKGAWTQTVKPFVRNPHLQNPDLFLKAPEFRDHIFLEAKKFSAYLTEDWFEPFQETSYTDQSLLRNRMMNEMFHEAVPVILHEDDLNAMYFSIENRSPFLDRNLFDFCYQIPSAHLIQSGRAKAVLREAMRGIVPDKILDNPRKVGFNAPVHSFLDVKEDSVQQTLLEDSPVFSYVKKEKIKPLLEKSSLPNSESKFLFYFLCTKLFLEASMS